jgi:hypothetical protein
LAERYRGKEQDRPFGVMERMRCMSALLSDDRMRGLDVARHRGWLLAHE